MARLSLPITINYQTITPLYTGNSEGEMDRLRETGFMGSMRWWFEALVRGAGGLACDPTADNKSGFNREEYESETEQNDRLRLRNAGLDDAAQIFGGTGWRRRFRLSVEGTINGEKPKQQTITLDSRENHRGQQPRWYLKDKPYTDNFSLTLQPLFPDFDVALINDLLQLMEQWGGIAAKNQLGLGVVERLGDAAAPDGEHLCQWLQGVPETTVEQRKEMAALPSLGNMFFARFHSQGNNRSKTFELKYDLREKFRNSRITRRFVMGTVKPERTASKIMMSWPYGEHNTIRVWGWLPVKSTCYRDGWTRDSVLDTIRQHIEQLDPGLIWHEFDSGRDTAHRELDINSFLAALFNDRRTA